MRYFYAVAFADGNAAVAFDVAVVVVEGGEMEVVFGVAAE